MTAPVMPLADLIAEVAAEHVLWADFDGTSGYCGACSQPWPCKPARLAAALSVENVAAGLHAVLRQRDLRTEIGTTLPILAAALLAAIKEKQNGSGS